jgi:ABC-type lipoprotein export system ATPase subunit
VGRLSDRRRSQLRNKHYGFVFQVYNLLPRLTALENVMVPLIFAGVPKRAQRSRAEAALEAMGLRDRMRHQPSELSGGEQQRVAIARALINEPTVIFADEPTGNLDSKSGAVIMDLIQQLHRERKVTVVLITHDPAIARRAERSIYIRDGLVANGTGGDEEAVDAEPDVKPSV